jgi:hypothetical protein
MQVRLASHVAGTLLSARPSAKKKGSIEIDAACTASETALLHVIADFRFVNRRVQMLDRFHPMSLVIVRRVLQMVLGIVHRVQSSTDLGVRFG